MRLLVAVLALALATPSWALLIVGGANNGIDVGVIDTIRGVTADLQSGGGNACPNGSNPDAEECWAEKQTGITDLVYTGVKNGTVAVNSTSQSGVIAFALASGPGFYIVKNAQTWVLLENLASSDWGVLDTTDTALAGFKLNLGKTDQLTISHVTEFNGTKTPPVHVPEPGSLALLMLGIIGLGAAQMRGRKRC